MGPKVVIWGTCHFWECSTDAGQSVIHQLGNKVWVMNPEILARTINHVDVNKIEFHSFQNSMKSHTYAFHQNDNLIVKASI